VSPLLSNIYLHEVLDHVVRNGRGTPDFGRGDSCSGTRTTWFIILASEDDARRVMEVLGKRFAKYGLTLHPEKTRMLGLPADPRGPQPPAGTNRRVAFDMLGFTWFWGRSRKGSPIIRRKDIVPAVFRRALGRIADLVPAPPARPGRHTNI